MTEWNVGACLGRADEYLKAWKREGRAAALVHAALELRWALELYLLARAEEITGERPNAEGREPLELLDEALLLHDEAMSPQTWGIGVMEDIKENPLRALAQRHAGTDAAQGAHVLRATGGACARHGALSAARGIAGVLDTAASATRADSCGAFRDLPAATARRAPGNGPVTGTEQGAVLITIAALGRMQVEARGERLYVICRGPSALREFRGCGDKTWRSMTISNIRFPRTDDSHTFAGGNAGVGGAVRARLAAGSVLALYGELGAGKTVVAKGIGRGLGVTDEIISPTFNYILEYSGRLPLFHADLYRIDNAAGFQALGFDEYFDRGGIFLIEWPERVRELLPPGTLWVSIMPGDNPGERTITVRTTAA